VVHDLVAFPALLEEVDLCLVELLPPLGVERLRRRQAVREGDRVHAFVAVGVDSK
jgi:hypothetical protein